MSYFISLMYTFLNWTRLGGPTQTPPLLFPWCWKASLPRSGMLGMVAPGITVFPLSEIVTVLALTVISKWFHSPTGLSACVIGVAAAFRAGGLLGSVRMLKISP